MVTHAVELTTKMAINRPLKPYEKQENMRPKKVRLIFIHTAFVFFRFKKQYNRLSS